MCTVDGVLAGSAASRGGKDAILVLRCRSVAGITLTFACSVWIYHAGFWCQGDVEGNLKEDMERILEVGEFLAGCG